jgi:hypothetical protein
MLLPRCGHAAQVQGGAKLIATYIFEDMVLSLYLLSHSCSYLLGPFFG